MITPKSVMKEKVLSTLSRRSTFKNWRNLISCQEFIQIGNHIKNVIAKSNMFQGFKKKLRKLVVLTAKTLSIISTEKITWKMYRKTIVTLESEIVSANNCTIAVAIIIEAIKRWYPRVEVIASRIL
jgi:hypothetical protein